MPASAPASASRSGCRAASRPRSSSSPARAWAMSATRRSTATTPAARLSRCSSAPAPPLFLRSRATAPMPPRAIFFRCSVALPRLKKVYRVDPLRSDVAENDRPIGFGSLPRAGAGSLPCSTQSRSHHVSRLHVRHDRPAQRGHAFGQYRARERPGDRQGLGVRPGYDRLLIQPHEPQYRHRRLGRCDRLRR